MTNAAHEIPELDRKGLRQFGLVTGGIVAGLFGLLFPWLLERALPLWPSLGGVRGLSLLVRWRTAYSASRLSNLDAVWVTAQPHHDPGCPGYRVLWSHHPYGLGHARCGERSHGATLG